MKKEEFNLVTLTIIEEDLSDEQLDRILGYMTEVAKVIEELEGEDENE